MLQVEIVVRNVPFPIIQDMLAVLRAINVKTKPVINVVASSHVEKGMPSLKLINYKISVTSQCIFNPVT